MLPRTGTNVIGVYPTSLAIPADPKWWVAEGGKAAGAFNTDYGQYRGLTRLAEAVDKVNDYDV
jgi:hypothetical protein